MPEYAKIGFTHGNIRERLKQLDRTGVPLPFEVYYAAIVEDAEKEEKWLHSIFADRRTRDREFFKMNPEYAALALKRVGIREIKIDSKLTPEQEREVDKAKERRSRFHFEKYGIPIGSRLTFTRDSSIIADVVESDKIKISGKINSLSGFAMELLGYRRKPQGTLYFKFEDEILDDRRRRMDEEDPSEKEIEDAGERWIQQQADIARGK